MKEFIKSGNLVKFAYKRKTSSEIKMYNDILITSVSGDRFFALNEFGERRQFLFSNLMDDSIELLGENVIPFTEDIITVFKKTGKSTVEVGDFIPNVIKLLIFEDFVVLSTIDQGDITSPIECISKVMSSTGEIIPFNEEFLSEIINEFNETNLPVDETTSFQECKNTESTGISITINERGEKSINFDKTLLSDEVAMKNIIKLINSI